tara:strand:+ start:286 stop:453 length:168 start_codon:yes stop_codon:yes gene_type:complete
MQVGDLVRRAHSMNKTLGVIVKVTPEYRTTEYHVLVGGIVQYFAARHLEVINESR